MNDRPSEGRIAILDPLRGIAASAVAWYHLTNALELLPDGWLKASGSYGFLGVQMFFVISGCIIPYSMAKGGYRVRRDWGRFLAKRIVRLDPPYLVSVALAAVLLVTLPRVPWFRPPQPHLGLKWLLLHLGYLNAFVGWGWLNPVYWTLAVEFQYYLAIALLFPLLMRGSVARRMTLLIGCAAIALAPVPDAFLPRHLALFVLGIATCQLLTAQLSRTQYVAIVVPVAAIAWYANGACATGVGLATATLIGAAPGRTLWRPFLWLGGISYSLYLLHFLIEGTVVELLGRAAHGFGAQIAVLLLAAAATLAASVLLHRAVEAPAQRWSAAIRYLGASRSPMSAPPAVAKPAA
jgi:peptidoglycan/LPS O-acetylase OafA/YrhL